MKELEITTHLTLIVPGKNRSVKNAEKRDKILHGIFLAIVYIFIIIFAFVVLLPFYYMIAASFMVEDQLNSGAFFPSLANIFETIANNYTHTISNPSFPYGELLLNTLIVGIVTTASSLLVTILSAFAFAKLHFKGKEVLFTIFLANMMIPGEMMAITNFTTMANLGFVSADQNRLQTYLALILPFVSNVFYIYLLRQTFMQIPNELYLASKVDGKSDWQYLWKVMVPLSSSTLITIFIMNFIESWNSYVWPNLVILNDDYNVLSIALRSTTFQVLEHEVWRPVYTQQMAATVLTTVPLLLLFIFFRKYIMRGVERAGIKG